MKLNAKGIAAYEKWSNLWDYEIAEQEMIATARNDWSNVEYGWSCVEYLVENEVDEAELMILADEDNAFYHILGVDYVGLDEIWCFDTTKREFLRLLVKYLDMEDDEDREAVKRVCQIYRVGSYTADRMMDKMTDSDTPGENMPVGLFLWTEYGKYLAMDNLDGYAWINEYQTEDEAIHWLICADE